jgi:tetratricopeptide (TPR) repeat protein
MYTLEEIEKLLSSENVGYDSLKEIYDTLATIVKANSKYADQAIDLIKQGLASDTNDVYSLKRAYSALANIVAAKPTCADKAIEAIKQGLASDKNDTNSLRDACGALAKIVAANPTCADKAVEAIKQGLASDKNDGYSLASAYSDLAEIVAANPECADKAFEAIKQGLASDKNYSNSLQCAYGALAKIVKVKSEYADQAIELIQQRLSFLKGDRFLSKSTWEDLARIVAAKPECADKVLEVLKQGVDLGLYNRPESTQSAGHALAKIVKANPKYAEPTLELSKIILATAMTSNIKKVSYAHRAARGVYDAWAEIVAAKPELGSQILSMLEADCSSMPERARYSSFLIEEDIQCVRAAAGCLHGKKPQDLEAYSHILFLDIAFKFRRSLSEEAEWMLTHIPVEQLQTMSLSGQQKALNIMVGLACKTDGMAAPKAEDLRGLNKNEAVVQTFRDNATFLVEASYKAGGIFGSFLPTYLKKMEPYFMGKNSKDTILGLDKVVGWFPDPMSPEKNKSFQDFCLNKIVHKTHQSIYDHQNKEVIYTPENAIDKLRPVEELSVIARNWAYLSPEEEKLPYNDILAICQSRKYPDQTYTEFAIEAASHGVSPQEYKKWKAFMLPAWIHRFRLIPRRAMKLLYQQRRLISTPKQMKKKRERLNASISGVGLLDLRPKMDLLDSTQLVVSI